MNKYNSYKDSGVEWIGEIPNHWKKGKLYQYSELSNGSTPSRIKPEYWENGTIPWMSSGEINKNRIREIDGRITHEGFQNSSTKLLPVGTVMMGLNGQGKTKGTVGILEIETTCNQSLCGMIFNDDIYSMFGYYFLDSQYYHVRGLVGEGQREGISTSFLSGYPLLIPPLSEQQQIVSFLDTKTSLIDSLIEKTQQKIELLKEKRTSLINEVVTKGLNPNVDMKDSGVEWIGEIPSHWEITKMKYGVSHLSEKGKPEKTDIKISPENVESDTGVCFNLYSEHESEGMRFQSGDILLNKLRLYLKKILYTDYNGFSLGEMIVLRTNNKLNNKYFYQLLFSQGLIDLLDSQSTGIKLPRVSPDVILNTEIVYPTLNEQQQIVEYLDEQTQLIDKTISIEEKRIELLKEYRKSLISEVVTGKRKVV